MTDSPLYAPQRSRVRLAVVLVCAVLAGTLGAQSFVMDFDTDDSGGALVAGVSNLGSQPYANLFGPGSGVTLSTANPVNRPLNLYNTEGVGGEDDDLERNSTGSGLWEGGNATATVFGNVMIVNETPDISVPDDDGVGGNMVLAFDRRLLAFGFDFIDMDTAVNAKLIIGDGVTSVEIPFAAFEEGSGSIHEVANVSFGNRNANRIPDIRASEIGLADFNRVEFVLSSSGGIGTVYMETIPEPGSVTLVVLGFSGLLFRRSRAS